MKRRPEFKDPWEAAKVSSFMVPAEHGRWKIVRFTITERHATISHMMAAIEQGSKEERELRMQRTIPPGTYLSLQRRATPGELKDIEDGDILDGGSADGDPNYVPVMSDTPTEIREHYEVIRDAEGDVLITGLGLGCIISALLVKPEVNTITVVEIDKDVIALTAPYYDDEERVKIVNADAITAAKTFYDLGVYFDYAWHDIWSHISAHNLDDDALAEHGISYERMFDAWADVCDVQAAWAWHEARAMRLIKERDMAELHAWAEEFINSTDDARRIYLLQKFHVVNHLRNYNIGEEIPDEAFAFALEHMHVRESTAQQIEARGGLDAIAEDLKERLQFEKEHVPEPMQRPNEVPEANVATR
jgi:hypothetical protein